MNNTILIIDSNYLCHRARYTVGGLRYKNIPTGVIYGFLNQLFLLAKKTIPDEIVFAWDSRYSIRKERYSFYKEKRNIEVDSELIEAYEQFNLLREEILPKIGFVNNFIVKGYEADDIIAKIVQNKNNKYIVATSDDDLLQLLDYCTIFNLGKNKFIDKKYFIDKNRIEPKDWVEVKKIAGCSGDNVPGVNGVGEKTAIKYLTGSLKSDSKKYKSIEANQDIIERNEWLVKLPLPKTPDFDIKESEFDKQELKIICNKYGFMKLRNQIDEWDLFFNH